MAGRGGIRKNVGQNTKNGVGKGVKGKVGVKSNIGNNKALKKGDARLKIIQKNRSKLVDARDKLAQMAKKTDARAKLLKLRQMRTGAANLSTEIVQPVGKSILKKMDRNGKISLSTNKGSKVQSPQKDLNTTIRKELGLMEYKKMMNSPNRNQAKLNRNPRAGLPIRSLNTNKPRPINMNESPMFRSNLAMDQVYSRPPPVIQRTIHNDIIREIPREIPYNPTDPGLYSWMRSDSIAPRQPLKNVMPTVDLTSEWGYNELAHRTMKQPVYYMDEDMDDGVTSTRVCTVKTGVHARLDTPVAATQSQGIFAKAKPKVVVPDGHRIVVSNLQATVTQDDIRELFEDVGELLVSRLVRPGTAEVIYKSLRDAQKAVDTYHNRQLDGQPMKCLLVNKRPLNNPTAPALRPEKTSGTSILRTNGGITKKVITTASKNSNKLVPDISTIHKVLFHKT